MSLQDTNLDKLTKSGRDWLVSALDPFHDENLHLEGYPDQVSFPSVCMMHKQQYTISAPAIAAGGNWDARVDFTGMHSYSDYVATHSQVPLLQSQLHAYDHAALPTPVPYGSFLCSATGPGLRMNTALAVGESRVAFPSAITTCPSRLIGVAFEVHNTTAEVYRQGAVTTCPLSKGNVDTTSIYFTDTNVAPYVGRDIQVSYAPDLLTIVDDVRRSPQSKTWDARDGVYAIPKLIGGIDISSPYSSHRALVVRGYLASSVSEIEGAQTSGAVTVPWTYAPFITNFTPMTSYFTGLSTQTSLTVVMRTIVEYFPPPDANMYAAGPTLIPTSSPSSPYDPKALVLYSRLATVAPYCVPVGMNPAGEYFRLLMRIAARIAPGIAPLLGPFAPLAVAGGALLATGADVWQDFEKNKEKKAAALVRKPKLSKK